MRAVAKRRVPAAREKRRPLPARDDRIAQSTHGAQAIVVAAFRNAVEERTYPERAKERAPKSAAVSDRTKMRKSANAPASAMPRWTRRWRPRNRGARGAG
jgi:hypothetical protein